MNFENEITVKITCNYEELSNILLDKGFNITNELILTDIYLIKDDVDIFKTNNKDLLSNYLMIRIPSNNNPQIVYKYKEYNEDNSIKKQGKIVCDIYKDDSALNLLKAMGYKELFTLKNDIKFYKNADTIFVAALVNDEYLCLEYSKDDLSIDDVIKSFEENYNYIPYDHSNYFINKALHELDKLKSE